MRTRPKSSLIGITSVLLLSPALLPPVPSDLLGAGLLSRF